MNYSSSRVDEVVDFPEGFVVSPLSEAHNHHVEDAVNINTITRPYLEDGVFDVKNPNSIRPFTVHLADKVNGPTSIDVVFAHAGLTSTGGHPVVHWRPCHATIDIVWRGRKQPGVRKCCGPTTA